MQYFLTKYPKLGELFIGFLIAIVGWFVIDMRNTAIKSADKMVTAFEDMAREVKANTIKIAEHEVRINICEKGS